METINVLFHKVPFLRLAIFFALGCLAMVKGMNYIYAFIVLVSAILFLLLYFLISKQKEETEFSYRWFYGISVSAFMFAFGMIFSHNTFTPVVDTESHYYIGRVTNLPKVTSNSVKCTVALSEVDESRMQKNNETFDAVVFIQKSMSSENISIGDSLLISPKISSAPEKNEELRFDDSNIFFVQDDAWTMISRSTSFHAETLRDSLIGQLKKKDAPMMN